MALMTEQEAMKRLARLIVRNREMRVRLMEEAADTARTAHSAGMPETQIAKHLGVDRMTVRKWLGKL